MKGKCAKAWAPSTIVLMPRARAIAQIAFIGKIWPVRFVMWQKWMIFVRGVMACSNRCARSAMLGGGTGNAISFSLTASRRTRCRHVLSIRP